MSSLTFWKTVLYMMQYLDLCNGGHAVAHLNWSQYVFLFWVPSGVWLVCPAYFIVTYGLQLRALIQTESKKRKEKKN